MDAIPRGVVLFHIILPFIITVGAIVLMRPIAFHIGLVDHPDTRKKHSGQVPLLGGITMLLALASTSIGLHLHDKGLKAFLMASSVLVLVGAWDDMKNLSVRVRFPAQTVAVLLMVYLGHVRLHNLGDLLGHGPVLLGWLAVPFTLFCVVGVINAVNMIDGLDGLAGGCSLIALGWFAIADRFSGGPQLSAHTILLIGALAGFLLFNFRFPWQPRFRIFMGDAGSMLLGFALSWTAISLTQSGDGHGLSPITAVWILGVPLMDTVSLMLRRGLRGRSMFTADRDHLHHALIDAGLSVRQAVGVIYALTILFGLIGVIGWKVGIAQPIMLTIFLVTFVVYTITLASVRRMRVVRRRRRMTHIQGMRDT